MNFDKPFPDLVNQLFEVDAKSIIPGSRKQETYRINFMKKLNNYTILKMSEYLDSGVCPINTKLYKEIRKTIKWLSSKKIEEYMYIQTSDDDNFVEYLALHNPFMVLHFSNDYLRIKFLIKNIKNKLVLFCLHGFMENLNRKSVNLIWNLITEQEKYKIYYETKNINPIKLDISEEYIKRVVGHNVIKKPDSGKPVINVGVQMILFGIQTKKIKFRTPELFDYNVFRILYKMVTKKSG